MSGAGIFMQDMFPNPAKYCLLCNPDMPAKYNRTF